MFSTIELNGMREVQEAHMMDECIVYHVTSKVKNKRGIYEKAFDEGTRVHCGVRKDPMDMYDSMSMRTADVDIVLRLPLSVVVKPEDEIEITKRFGAEVTPTRYEVVRYVNDGPSGCRAYLRVRNVI